MSTKEESSSESEIDELLSKINTKYSTQTSNELESLHPLSAYDEAMESTPIEEAKLPTEKSIMIHPRHISFDNGDSSNESKIFECSAEPKVGEKNNNLSKYYPKAPVSSNVGDEIDTSSKRFRLYPYRTNEDRFTIQNQQKIEAAIAHGILYLGWYTMCHTPDTDIFSSCI